MRKRPGPKPSITMAVVRRVSKRVGRGMTLETSLSTEGVATINLETWKKALKAHPQFSPHYEAARGKFLDGAMTRLATAKELKYLCWLLERRHSDLFGKQQPETQVVVNNTIAGLPDDVLARARTIAGGNLAAKNAENTKPDEPEA